MDALSASRLARRLPRSPRLAICLRRSPRIARSLVHGVGQNPTSATNAACNQPISSEGQPSARALKQHFIACAVPFVGFGFVDNTVMIQVGNCIDLTLGVTFGLSTMAAAACGQICSDIAGVMGGGAIEAAATRLGLPTPDFTEAQRKLRIVKRVGIAGQLIGVFCGCSLGLLNLLLIDTSRAAELKVAAGPGIEESDFNVHISNRISDEATVLTIEGPDCIGLVASVCSALSAASCSILQVHGESKNNGTVHDQFHITRNKAQVDDAELTQLALDVLGACRSVGSSHVTQVSKANQILRQENLQLRKRLGLPLEEADTD